MFASRRFRALFLSALACCLALPAAFGAARAEQSANGETGGLAPFVTSLAGTLEESGLSVIVGVGKTSHPTHFQEHGAFREDALAPEETLVDLGSNTKAATAAVVLKHVERGTLSLDDRLGALLDGVPADKRAITLRQLLTHTAGLPDAVGPDEEKIERDAYLQRVFRTPLASVPGTEYAYSNVGYSLLAALLEKSTGRPFDALLAETLFPGAEIPAIGYELAYREEASAISGRSLLTVFRKLPIHRSSWGGTPVGWNLMGNGGAVATPVNAMTFYEDLVNGRIVDLSLWQGGFAPTGRETAGFSYGYGIVRLKEPDGTVIYTHAGANIVFSVDWRFYPHSGIMIFTAGLGDDAKKAMTIAVEQITARQLR